MKNVSHNINTLKCRDKALEKGEGAVRAPLTRARKKPRQQQEDRNERRTISKDVRQEQAEPRRKSRARHLCIKTEKNNKKPTKDKTLTNDYLALAGALKRKLRHKS